MSVCRCALSGAQYKTINVRGHAFIKHLISHMRVECVANVGL
jgi:hypothetical protein